MAFSYMLPTTGGVPEWVEMADERGDSSGTEGQAVSGA